MQAIGFTGPGLSPLRFSATDHSGYGGLRMAKVQGGKQKVFGPLYTTDDGTGPVTAGTPSQATPPANGIPS